MSKNILIVCFGRCLIYVMHDELAPSPKDPYILSWISSQSGICDTMNWQTGKYIYRNDLAHSQVCVVMNWLTVKFVYHDELVHSHVYLSGIAYSDVCTEYVLAGSHESGINLKFKCIFCSHNSYTSVDKLRKCETHSTA